MEFISDLTTGIAVGTVGRSAYYSHTSKDPEVQALSQRKLACAANFAKSKGKKTLILFFVPWLIIFLLLGLSKVNIKLPKIISSIIGIGVIGSWIYLGIMSTFVWPVQLIKMQTTSSQDTLDKYKSCPSRS